MPLQFSIIEEKWLGGSANLCTIDQSNLLSHTVFMSLHLSLVGPQRLERRNLPPNPKGDPRWAASAWRSPDRKHCPVRGPYANVRVQVHQR
jgi:hypothetical protein